MSIKEYVSPCGNCKSIEYDFPIFYDGKPYCKKECVKEAMDDKIKSWFDFSKIDFKLGDWKLL